MAETFNLIDERWIIAVDSNGGTGEYSIRQLLCDTGDVVSIGGDMPTQQFAITRVLLAIIRRAIDWGDDPVARWAELWCAEQLPAAMISDYLDSVRDRFDLLDPVRPFYQVPDFQTSKDVVMPIGLMISDYPTRHKYFTTRAGSGARDLSLAEAARWIVHTQAYDASGIKTGDIRDPRTKSGKNYPIGIAWAGQLGGVLLEGSNVTETLLLNTPLLVSGESTVVAGDLPVWEREHPGILPRDPSEPTGPIDLLTWQSRRIRLFCNNGRATGVIVGNGDPIESYNKNKIEFLTPWRFSEIQSKKAGEKRFYPRNFDPDRALWRGLEGLLVDVDEEYRRNARGYAPGVVKWLDHLLDHEIVDGDHVISPHAFGFRYDSNAAMVGAAVDDRISLRVAAFGEASELKQCAIEAAQLAETVAWTVGSLGKALAVAAGGDGEGERASATAQFLAEVDVPFRGWVTRLGVDEMDALVIRWHTTLYRIAAMRGGELIRQAGRPAYVGREVTDSRGNERWVDAPSAADNFRLALKRELPEAFGEM